LAPLTGIAFVALLIVGFAIGGEPPDPTDDGVQEVVDFYIDNEGEVFAGAVLQALAAAFLVFFGGSLVRRLIAAGARASAAITFAGVIALAIGLAIDGTLSMALAEGGDDVDPSAIETLSLLWNNDFLPMALGMFVFLIGFGTAVVRHGVLPKWMGWVAIVAGLTAISPAFFVAGIVAALLILVTSVMLAREERAGGAAAA
jgi:hypothetical protein